VSAWPKSVAMAAKPDPLPPLEACRALQASPVRALVISDSANDAQAARAAGCVVVLLRYGYNPLPADRARDADAFVGRLDEVDRESG
jgi:phosphoglycolate phosphatase